MCVCGVSILVVILATKPLKGKSICLEDGVQAKIARKSWSHCTYSQEAGEMNTDVSFKTSQPRRWCCPHLK